MCCPQVALQTPRNITACLPLPSRVNFPPAEVLRKRLLPAHFQDNGHAQTSQYTEQPASSFDARQLTRVIGSRHPGLPAAQNGSSDTAIQSPGEKGSSEVLTPIPVSSSSRTVMITRAKDACQVVGDKSGGRGAPVGTCHAMCFALPRVAQL